MVLHTVWLCLSHHLTTLPAANEICDEEGPALKRHTGSTLQVFAYKLDKVLNQLVEAKAGQQEERLHLIDASVVISCLMRQNS